MGMDFGRYSRYFEQKESRGITRKYIECIKRCTMRKGQNYESAFGGLDPKTAYAHCGISDVNHRILINFVRRWVLQSNSNLS